MLCSFKRSPIEKSESVLQLAFSQQKYMDYTLDLELRTLHKKIAIEHDLPLYFRSGYCNENLADWVSQ